MFSKQILARKVEVLEKILNCKISDTVNFSTLENFFIIYGTQKHKTKN